MHEYCISLNQLLFHFVGQGESIVPCSVMHIFNWYLIDAHYISILTARLIDALWSPAGKGLLTSWLSFVMYNCDVVTFLLVSWVRCGA